jgi:hypothetical protein
VTVVVNKPGKITVSYNAAKDYVLFDWTSFNVTLDEIKAVHEDALATAKRHNCRNYIADTSRVTNALRQEIIAWWGTTWVPTLATFGLRTIVTVPPSSAIATMSTGSWQRQVVNGIAMLNAASLAEAEATLAKV